MKKYIFVLVVLCISSTAFSQLRRAGTKKTMDSTSSPRMTREDRMERKEKLKELNLTEAQKVSMKEARNLQQESKRAIENDASLSPEQKSRKLKELRVAQMKKMKTILTPEQLEKFKQMQKDKKAE